MVELQFEKFSALVCACFMCMTGWLSTTSFRIHAIDIEGIIGKCLVTTALVEYPEESVSSFLWILSFCNLHNPFHLLHEFWARPIPFLASPYSRSVRAALGRFGSLLFATSCSASVSQRYPSFSVMKSDTIIPELQLLGRMTWCSGLPHCEASSSLALNVDSS